MSTLLPSFYKSTLKNRLKRSEYFILLIIIGLLQKYQISTIEELANKFPSPILFESRRKKIQRFLSLSHLSFSTIWFPILSIWLSLTFEPLSVLYLAIDRTEWTGVNLLSLLLLITLAYSSAFFTGEKIQQKRQIKYVSRVKEKKRYVKRHSYFYIGLHGKDWVESLDFFEKIAESLMALSPHKRPNYKRGNRAATLIKCTL